MHNKLWWPRTNGCADASQTSGWFSLEIRRVRRMLCKRSRRHTSQWLVTSKSIQFQLIKWRRQTSTNVNNASSTRQIENYSFIFIIISQSMRSSGSLSPFLSLATHYSVSCKSICIGLAFSYSLKKINKINNYLITSRTQHCQQSTNRQRDNCVP